MRLNGCELRPGEVLKVENAYGVIKASCIGVFSNQDDPDLLPPIYPNSFVMLSPTQFAQPHVGDKIWVWLFDDNPQELYYTYRADVQPNNEGELNNEYDDIEIQMKRTDDNGEISVGYNNSDGYTINNHGSKINVDNENGDVHLSHKDGAAVSISKDKISLGKDGESQYKAVLGEELINVLNDIKSTFETIKNAAMGSPYTTHISTALTPAISKLNNFDKILSEMVTLQKN